MSETLLEKISNAAKERFQNIAFPTRKDEYWRFADLDTISAILVAMQEEKLGLDFLDKRNEYVSAVTLDEVNAAAARYFTAEGPVWVNLGKFANTGSMK